MLNDVVSGTYEAQISTGTKVPSKCVSAVGWIRAYWQKPTSDVFAEVLYGHGLPDCTSGGATTV